MDLKHVESNTLKIYIIDIISKAKEKRKQNNLSQVEYSKIKNLSLDSIKRIETGKCYNLKLISKYVQK